MKIGVLGTSFGAVHIGSFLQNPQVDEVVFFSRSQENVDKTTAEFKIKGTTDMDTILSDPTVDVVTIALPAARHADVAVRAMENGKDVICEIPVCLTLEEARQMQEVSRQTGKRVLVDQYMRFRAAHQAIHQMIQSEEHGKLLTIQMHNAAGPVWGVHPLSLKQLPMEMSYGDFDFLYWCLGKMDIQAVSAIQRDELSSGITVLLKSKTGTTAMFTNSSMQPKGYGMQERFEAVFERATVAFRESAWTDAGTNNEMTLYIGDEARAIPLSETNHYAQSLGYSLERIISGELGITDLEQAVPALELVLALENTQKAD